MADEKDERVCNNPPCNCKVKEGEKYCSTICEGGGGVTQIDCDCGHPECEGDL